MKLSAENVTNVLDIVLSSEKVETNNNICVKGIIHDYCFDKKKINEYQSDIESMLECLPDEFKEGWSFLNLCLDKDGNQWTSFHLTMEHLVVLGIAIERVVFPFPRDVWDVLPGCMPYILIT